MKKLIFLCLIFFAISLSAQETGSVYVKGYTHVIADTSVRDTLSRKIVSSTANDVSTVVRTYFVISITTSDSLEIANNAAFTSPTLIPPGSWNNDTYNFALNKNLYIRAGRNVTGTVKYSLAYRGK